MTTPNHSRYENQEVRIQNPNEDVLTPAELEAKLKGAIDSRLDDAFVMSLDEVSAVEHDAATGEDVYQATFTTYKGDKYAR